MTDEAVNKKLKVGLQCKACSRPLKITDDLELCMECMFVVDDYNSDIDKPDMEAFIELEEKEE